MKGLSENIASVNAKMGALETEREHAIASSRTIIRSTKRIIHGIHTGSPEPDLLRSAMSDMESLTMSLGPEMRSSGPVEDAMMELAEAALFDAVCRDAPLPSPEDICVSPQSWALGLADCLGEMRRIALSMLMEDRLEDAKRMFSSMEEICAEIMLFDVPDAIMPMRRKQDIARGVMEKTRTDLANAIVMRRA
jgi:translin